ncbi:nitroreductase/quinone reductase family protein [Cellulomonas algicola]|uniref:nitroreductase/quinone reductase family protein n=1 Tax=Cellulomonas algicola TaxID=2071633 RepID=UPI001C3F594D|nr:nitroreductase/quinone reductase family protein [Cellulomonas algicola]
MNDWNTHVIEEFRANAGQVGGHFAGEPLLLLHTTGARTGEPRVSPMMYQDLGDGRLAVFGSFAGRDVHPAWFHNLVAHPEERRAIWERQKQAYPRFAEYEQKTDREIPVVVLEPR